MESQISYKSYNETLGQSYLLKDHGLSLCLTEVSPQRISDPWESFSLLFRADTEFTLEQGTYLLKHDTLGELEIFLVPVGFSAENSLLMEFESVFNRQISRGK